MQICRTCLYKSSHPLGINFDSKGVCSGCLIHKEKDEIDWGDRLNKLKKILSDYRSKNGKNYDCIVPVTGAGDSYYILHLVKNILELNPLLVSYNKYYNTSAGIRNIANLRIKFDCDILIQNVNPQSVKKITRTTIRELGSIYWHVIAGQTSFPTQVAVTHKIPLVIWGAHQGLEQVGMFSHFDEVQMSRRYRKEHDLMGFEADDLISVFDTIHESDIWQYRYPDDHDLEKLGVIGIYLGNYFRWDPKSHHEMMIEKYDYKVLRQPRSFYSYDHFDCYNYINLHDYLKFLKCGYSKVTDHACREIRHGRLNRADALKIIKFYEAQKPLFTEMFSEWLDLSENGLQHLLREIKIKFKNPSAPKSPNVILKNDARIIQIQKKFKAKVSISKLRDSNYITFGKGYP